MLKDWQFNILFFVGVGGAVALFLGDKLGLGVSDNPSAHVGVGAILTYVLAQKRAQIVENNKKDKDAKPDTPDEGVDDGSR